MDGREGRRLRSYTAANCNRGQRGSRPCAQARRQRVVGFGNGAVAQLDAAGPRPLQLDRDLGNPVVTLHESATDALWIGTYTSGLYFARPLSHVIRFGRSDAAQMQGWPSVSLRALWGEGGHLLVGTDNGLMQQRAAGGEWMQVPGFEGRTVRVIGRAIDGGWWIGTHDGLWHWPGGGAPRRIPGLPDPRIDAMLVEGGTVWVATRGGLARVSNGEVVEDPALVPLAGRQVTALRRDDDRLWIATNTAGWQLDAGAVAAPSRHAGLHNRCGRCRRRRRAVGGSYSRPVPDRPRQRRDPQLQRPRRTGNKVVYAILRDAAGRLW